MLGQNCAGDDLSISIYGSRKAVGLLGGSDQLGGTEEGEPAPSGLAFRSAPLKPSYRSTQKNNQQGCACLVGLVGIKGKRRAGLGCGNG